jgi:hypothetical protein
MLSGAKSKNDRKWINQRAEQMRRDLYARHQDEIDGPFTEPTDDPAPPPLLLPLLPWIRSPIAASRTAKNASRKLNRNTHSNPTSSCA